MLSDKKSFLEIAEILCLCTCALDAVILAALGSRQFSPGTIEPLIWSGGLMVIFTAVVVFALIGEFKKAVGDDEDADGVSATEIADMIMWSPFVHKAGAVLGILFALIALLSSLLGGNADAELSPRRSAEVIVIGEMIISLIALPILAAAARMPGSYADQQR